MKILILDAQNQNTLAIVRHLGEKGYFVNVAGSKSASLSFYSKYVVKKIILPDPKKNGKKYIDALIKELSENKYDVLMPVGFKSYQLCAESQNEIRKYTHLVVTSYSNIELASDKVLTYQLARSLNVPCPVTYQIEAANNFKDKEIIFPVVIKAPFESGKNIVEYAYNPNQAVEIFSKMKSSLNGVSPIVQKYVSGDGYGFFAYYKDGKCIKYFMHHRIREYPVTGGASVCAESFSDDKLKETGMLLLDHLKWNGVAMVEFKKDNTDGKYYLMEINPKFWGSLELALCSGVDFPEYIIMEQRGEVIPAINLYKEKVVFQWILNGELFHFLERPSSFLRIIKTMLISKKDFRWSDIKPNLFQFVNIFVHYYKKITSR
ncbi:MAG: carboxylate--amine ligase [Bacteroidetes bacterium]|nr:carboxylate--amine ligase [Bacteroidota bacterium]